MASTVWGLSPSVWAGGFRSHFWCARITGLDKAVQLAEPFAEDLLFLKPFDACSRFYGYSGFLAFSSTFLKSVLCFSHVGRKILSAANESFLKLLHNIPINCRLSGASSASENKVGAQIFTGTNFVHHISYDIFQPYGLPSHLSRRTRIRFCCRYAWTFL